ncbi:glycerol-3-phosphate responsive antiterminator [Aneurinibacillus aneurinilyticus ATCC 12856]|uniref:Glycerol-3-phosphate responsive antiterminator n=1 Tax=Aneurinibacillus aneurinilyticus ATCC 12856 TaxID=649747 RepID=U1X3E9_ANEAE|nr:glycerol-3-phosphate responsive antiterminator [Aneurinibacillus aneurinilyticus]ERI09078.1 glycerol-3-phosphate responsive antiterminator [Aneurinibacillus aneurinilyticus ATCC 12856]
MTVCGRGLCPVILFKVFLFERRRTVKRTDFYAELEASRKIASIKDEKFLEKALDADVGAVVLSIGNIGNITRYVQLYKSHGIFVFVHPERIGGMSQDKEGIAFLARCVKPDGIVTTRNSLIKQAKKHGLLTIQRFFLVDSDAIKSSLESVRETAPDAVEIMPGLLPEFITEFRRHICVPVIAGGLLSNRNQMVKALRNGAIAVSMGNHRLWREKVNGEPYSLSAV